MKKRKISKLLIANRGEIALRVMRACKELGISTVAVYSDIDRRSMHVISADEAYLLGGITPRESYLNQSGIIEIARAASVDAIHPGYGFLAENPDFAEAVQSAGLLFIGPEGDAIRKMGDKTQARKIARQLGVPTIAGTIEPLENEEEGRQRASALGFPILLKAAAGGGGKGMRVVRSMDEFAGALKMAQSEAKGAFNDERVYLEKYLDSPRHIEIQIIGDREGNIVYLGERECSIQRRHQKVVEESPSLAVDDELRRNLGESAVRLAKHAGYFNAGTMEFLLDGAGHYYFLEMNTRLQVEHPVTEEIAGIDLVQLQIRVAEGESLPFCQADIQIRGHSIECRICAEDPENGFMPSTGRLSRYELPQGRIRVENGFRQGDEITVYYDSLLAKVISRGQNRDEAIRTMRRALSEFFVEGVKTTIPFCSFVLNHKNFLEGNFNTAFVDKHFSPSSISLTSEDEAIAAAICATLLHADAIAGRKSVSHNSNHGASRWKAAREGGLR